MMGSERMWFYFGHILGVCWTFNIAGQVEIRVWSLREFPRHQFTSRDSHLGHDSDSVPLAYGQRSGMKTGKKGKQEKRFLQEKEFREVKDSHQGVNRDKPRIWVVRLAWRSSVHQVQGSVEPSSPSTLSSCLPLLSHWGVSLCVWGSFSVDTVNSCGPETSCAHFCNPALCHTASAQWTFFF